jgi:hypothetical protein
MKRFIKGCIIAGVACIFIGGGITAVSVALGGNLMDVLPEQAIQWKQELGNVTQEEFWDKSKFMYDFNQSDFTDQGQPIYTASGIKELGGVITAGKVIIQEDSPGEEVTIFCNQDDSYYSIEEDNGELQLNSHPGDNLGNERDLLFTIHIPKDYRFSNVEFKLKRSNKLNGRYDSDVVLIADALSADEINLEVKAGAIKIGQGNAGELTVETEVGAVDFSGTTTGDISAKCQAGAIELQLDGKKEDYDYDVRCKLGAIELGDEEIAVLGSKKQIDNGSDKTMDLDCEVGAIQVDFMNQV